jgi:hypothetical protein
MSTPPACLRLRSIISPPRPPRRTDSSTSQLGLAPGTGLSFAQERFEFAARRELALRSEAATRKGCRCIRGAQQSIARQPFEDAPRERRVEDIARTGRVARRDHKRGARDLAIANPRKATAIPERCDGHPGTELHETVEAAPNRSI